MSGQRDCPINPPSPSVSSGGAQTIYCAIHDLSLTGAKIQVGVKLPKCFELIIDGLQAQVSVELKWQNAEYAGLAFQETLSTADINDARLRARLVSKRF